MYIEFPAPLPESLSKSLLFQDMLHSLKHSCRPEAILGCLSKTSANISFFKWSMVAGFATGLHGLTRNLALDLKPIRVNLVSPGVVETELWDSSFDQESKKKYLKGIAENLPTGRVAQPADVAEAYLFLMKDPSVTGTVVDSNSGALLI